LLYAPSNASPLTFANVRKQNVDQQICTAVAHILREERLKRKLSLNVLAAKAGLSYQIISYIERELRTPKLDTLVRITSALEIELSDVLRRAERR
jgi:transcriptional regulator with XRE-family HTH domain